MKLAKLAAVSLFALILCSWFSTTIVRPSAAVQTDTTTDHDVSCGSGRISRPCPF